MSEKIFHWPKQPALAKPPHYKIKDIAAIVPAHNEGKSIRRAIKALLRIFPQKNIYVASDYSTDDTNEVVRKMGVQLLDIRPNRGKARALVYIMQEYHLLERYSLVLINDSDTEINKNFVKKSLPYFNDPEVACIATHSVPRMGEYSFWQKYFVSYRVRLWYIIQLGMRFGQTWRYLNMSFIVPGSLSLYRTSVLKKIEIDAPGLLIEDFNMTFELHKKKLGKIVYNPKIFGTHQDPYNLRDYVRQVERWNIGFFQTVKRHGIWLSLFWFFTTAYYVELYFFAFFILFIPIFIGLFFLNHFQPLYVPFLFRPLTVIDLFVAIFVIDYSITIIAAIIAKNPSLLFYGLGFFFLRYLDAFIYIGSPVAAFFSKSTGVWKSPKRM